jgi:hypothetical protein
VELIDSLGDQAWSDEDLPKLAVERDTELESGAVGALSCEAFVSVAAHRGRCINPAVQREGSLLTVPSVGCFHLI